MYLVRARTSGGGVGSSRPRSEIGRRVLLRRRIHRVVRQHRAQLGVDVRRALLLLRRRRRARKRAWVSVRRRPAAARRVASPVRFPREDPARRRRSVLVSGAVPACCATAAVLVGLGLGTPLTRSAASRAQSRRALGRGLCGAIGAGVAAFALGCAVGCRRVGRRGARNAARATEPARARCVGGGSSAATAIGPTVGTLTGAAGMLRARLRLEDVLRRLRIGLLRRLRNRRGFGGAVGADCRAARGVAAACVAFAAHVSGACSHRRDARHVRHGRSALRAATGAATTGGDVRSSVTTRRRETFSLAPCCDELRAP